MKWEYKVIQDQGVTERTNKEVIEKFGEILSNRNLTIDKLKYWDYEEISRVHESLEYVNSIINNLSLVPQGF